MHPWICKTCCAEFPPSDTPPSRCPICSDDRQYVKPDGQKWTFETELAQNHTSQVIEVEPGLVGIGVEPSIGIGQRALLIEHADGGVMWDGVPCLDDAAIAEIKRRGGVRAMVMSHPHLYGAMITNSQKLGDVPIHIPAADRNWVMYPHANVHFFEGDRLDLGDGVTLHVTGGHFDGSALLHWAGGADGNGALFTGDTIMITTDTNWASFLYSYPNLIPLGPKAVQHIADIVDGLSFDRAYGAWWEKIMQSGAKHKIAASAERYLQAIA